MCGEDGLDIIQNAQKSIYKIDQSLLLQKASEYPFLTQIARCTGCQITRCTGWKRLWDDALDYGPSVQGPEEPSPGDHIPQPFSNKMPTL